MIECPSCSSPFGTNLVCNACHSGRRNKDRRRAQREAASARREADGSGATAQIIETKITVNVALGIGEAFEIWPSLARTDRP